MLDEQILPLPELKNKSDDIIFKITFNATKHTIKMYNRIYVSTRALTLNGVNPESQPEVQHWLQKIYNAYFKIRNITVGAINTNIDLKKVPDLITTYCEVLKKDECIQDYWVTLYHNDKKLLDSKIMQL